MGKRKCKFGQGLAVTPLKFYVVERNIMKNNNISYTPTRITAKYQAVWSLWV